MSVKKKIKIETWVKRIIHGNAGFKSMEYHEIAIFKDRDVAIAEFIIRALGNIYCEGSQDVIEAIIQNRNKNECSKRNNN